MRRETVGKMPATDGMFISGADILTASLSEPVWIIPDLLPVGLCLFAGAPKLGKSWLALQAARAVAGGGVFLGRKIEQGNVICFALEDSVRRLQCRMQRQGWTEEQAACVDFVLAGGYADKIGDLCGDGSDRLSGYPVVALVAIVPVCTALQRSIHRPR
jgi:hypothetical protein